MRNVIGLILVLLLTVNCKQGSSSSSSDSSRGTGFGATNFIPDDRANLGELANHMIDNYSIVSKAFASGQDLNTFYAARASINAHVKANDMSGTYDADANAGLSAWKDLVGDTSNNKGVTSYGLSQITCDVMSSFGLDCRIVRFDGNANAIFPEGIHFANEVYIEGKWVAVDSKLNCILQPNGTEAFNAVSRGFAASFEEALPLLATDAKSILRDPTGYVYMSDTTDGSYFEFYEDNKLIEKANWEMVRDDVLINASYIKHDPNRN